MDIEDGKSNAMKFKRELLKRSKSKHWETAKREWRDMRYIIDDDDEHQYSEHYIDLDISFCQLQNNTFIDHGDKDLIFKHHLNEYEKNRCICGHYIQDYC